MHEHTMYVLFDISTFLTRETRLQVTEKGSCNFDGESPGAIAYLSAQVVLRTVASIVTYFGCVGQ